MLEKIKENRNRGLFGVSRPPLMRMLRIESRLREGGFPNCRTLSEELEVSEKTVQRDIDMMRDQIGVAVLYDRSQHGYYLGEGGASVPVVRLSEGELLALFLAEKMLGDLQPSRFASQVREAIQRISLYAEDSFDVEWDALKEVVSIAEGSVAPADAEVFTHLEKGVRDRREVSFFYKKPGQKRATKRRLHPYHLKSVNGGWYVHGYDPLREAMRTFALARMSKMTVLGAGFQRPEDYSAEEWLRGSFGVFEGDQGNVKIVRLRFDAFAGQHVRERKWHHSQEISERGDEGLELTLRLSALEEVERWVMSWGEHVEVLAPIALRRRMARYGEWLQGQYPV